MSNETDTETGSSVSDQSDEILAVNSLFAVNDGAVTLKSGVTVKVFPAKMGQLALIIKFFQRVVDSLDKYQIANLIDLAVTVQRKAIEDGKNPNNLDLAVLTTQEVTDKAFGNVSLLMSLAATVTDLIPELVAAFTDMSAEKVSELDLDEGLALVGTVFLENYHFFTQSLPPILTGFVRSWASKNMASVPR